MTTRLDRLVALLESGSNSVIRQAAAKQIGDLAKHHPDEIYSLLARDKTWETRVAASQAISAIASHVQPYRPTEEDAKLFTSPNEPAQQNLDLQNLQQFSISSILASGALLLASDHGNNSTTSMDMEDDISMDLDVDVGEYLQYDIPSTPTPTTEKKTKRKSKKASPNSNSTPMTPTSPGTMTAQQKFLAKKEAKKTKRKETMDVPKEEIRAAKRTKTMVTEQPQTTQKLVIESVVAKDQVQHDRWAFDSLTAQLKKNMCHPVWEIRHGAALGLKEILKYHAPSAGKTVYVTEQERSAQNSALLDDICCTLLRIFALDRFADFVSDQAVAPVRETCAQMLGIVLHYTCENAVQLVIKNLITLLKQKQWEVRYAGLLGLKYAVAVRPDVVKTQLQYILENVVPSLDDAIDDVRAVAGDTLYPIAEAIVLLAPKKLPDLRDILWNILLDLDDLSAATSSIMKLLAKFYFMTGDASSPGHAAFYTDQLTGMVPRLWPFFRHNLLSVRMATIDTLELIVQPAASKKWLQSILSDVLRYVFQNIILESKPQIIDKSLRVWKQLVNHMNADLVMKISDQYLGSWMSLLSTNVGTSMDTSQLLLPMSVRSYLQGKSQPKQLDKKKARRKSDSAIPADVDQSESEAKVFDIRIALTDMEEATQMKMHGATALAHLITACYNQNSKVSLKTVHTGIATVLASDWACHKQMAAYLTQQLTTIEGYAGRVPIPIESIQKLQSLVNTPNHQFAEIQAAITQYLNDCNMLLQVYMSMGIDINPYISNQSVSFEAASLLVAKVYDDCIKVIGTNQQLVQETTTRKNKVQASMDFYSSASTQTNTLTMAALSAALVAANALPDDLTHVVHWLLTSIQSEKKSTSAQRQSAEALASLLFKCQSREFCPNSAIVQKIFELLASSMPVELAEQYSTKAADNATDPVPVPIETQTTNRGTCMAITSIVSTFGSTLFQSIPILHAFTFQILYHPQATTEQMVLALYLLRIAVSSVHVSLHDHFIALMRDRLFALIACPAEIVSLHASATIAAFCKTIMHASIKQIYEGMLPLMADPKNMLQRRGAVRTLSKIITVLELDILPYIVLFVVPLLKRMSDQDEMTREIASSCFGSVIKILPLEKSVAPAPDFEHIRDKERKFLEQLLDNSKVEPYEIKIKINAELRQYQKDGVSWLAFLNKFNLHGILCDDMGLGKTLQTICIVASDIIERKAKYEETKSREFVHLPSLVVCPPTLVGHWFYEVKKFCPELTVMQYAGNPAMRKSLRSDIPKYDFVIVSYDILRNDAERITVQDMGAVQSYNYCVLDEGHLIKNAKAKITKAVKQVHANHRLILSGTPIQNNVLELWSLFDYLMPGFLGSEKEFNQRYSKPILACRDAKANSKEHEAGTLALEALHRQVLPFLLRRMKEDVLHDLPEKIIQDYYCEMCPLQAKMYDEFSKKYVPSDALEDNAQANNAENKEGKEEKVHIFQALQYLRKLCNHPLLVLNENHPEYEKITQDATKHGKDLHDLDYCPKLQALKDLLHECGLGEKKETSDALGEPESAGHRVLIFCQLKSMLDIIENDLFKKHMPSLTFMRLDGGVDSMKRHALVTKFNEDPTIDVLLLTTHVGGLGLNLTGADTVIFVEHDWNPSADLQAMDRAHRIGQKRVVNVYRLITKDTLEEKIMGLQRFKLNIQKTVITKENSSMNTMGTNHLVDLFQQNAAAAASADKPTAGENKDPANKSVLQQVGELWDAEKQYEDYNLDAFLKSMNK